MPTVFDAYADHASFAYEYGIRDRGCSGPPPSSRLGTKAGP
ncbi:hypothetical protein ABZT02_11480 [Streptomyces sp. NPDC005402]